MAISDTINGATSDGAASAAGRDPRRGDLGIAAVMLAHPLMGQQPNDIPAVLARRQADLPLSSALTQALADRAVDRLPAVVRIPGSGHPPVTMQLASWIGPSNRRIVPPSPNVETWKGRYRKVTTNTSPAVSRLMGRGAELERLFEFVDGLSERGRSLVVRGEPGIGKTSLLAEATQRAADNGVRVLTAAGVQSEADLSFSGLHQLLAPVLGCTDQPEITPSTRSSAVEPLSARSLNPLDRLAAPQRDALGTAVGRGVGPPPDRLLVSLAVLNLLSHVAEERPLLCVVDDAGWLDRPSAQVLTFAARRLREERVGMVFATPGPAEDFTGLPELVVAGLTQRDVRRLLSLVVTAPLDAPVRERIVSETRGNPLALMELSRELSVVRFPGAFVAQAWSGASSPIEDGFRRRLTELPTETQRVLLIAAAEPLGDPLLLWRAASRLDIGLEAVEPARAVGLVSVGTRVVFRHPLLRSAIYGMASPEDRRAVHAALAHATDPGTHPAQRAWHRAQAAPRPCEDVAGELEGAAGEARERGGMAAAAAFLARAVALTPDPSERGRRAVAAAAATMHSGAPNDALGLLSIAKGSPLDEFREAQVDLLAAQAAFLVHRGEEAPTLLLRAARRLEPLDPALSREAYLDALDAAAFAGRFGEEGITGVARAARRAPVALQPPRSVDMLLDAFSLTLTEGYASGTPALKLALDAFTSADTPSEHQLRWGNVASHAAQIVWDERWGAISERVLRLGREAGVLSVLPIALTASCGWMLHAGDLDQAAALAEELVVVAQATETKLPPFAAIALAAWRGREAEALSLMRTARDGVVVSGDGSVLAYIGWMSSVLYNGQGRHADALEAAIRERAHPHDPWAPRWLHELIEAAIRTGDRERAAAALAELSEMARISGAQWALGIEARSRALLSEEGSAEFLYREAINRLACTEARVELARAHLLYGEWLRQQNRRSEARAELRTARDALASMGVEAFAERASRALSATGEPGRQRSTAALSELTGQELGIARLARDGLSNPEIGAHLFISPRTVKYHLRKVFTKLGISSRAELERALPRKECPKELEAVG
jgi:DNA-binding CsgD family transcriptional regulator